MESNASTSTASSPPTFGRGDATSPLLRTRTVGMYGSGLLTPVGSPVTGREGGGVGAGFVPGLDVLENSVEEPGRYAARLVDFIGGIVV